MITITPLVLNWSFACLSSLSYNIVKNSNWTCLKLNVPVVIFEQNAEVFVVFMYGNKYYHVKCD